MKVKTVNRRFFMNHVKSTYSKQFLKFFWVNRFAQNNCYFAKPHANICKKNSFFHFKLVRLFKSAKLYQILFEVVETFFCNRPDNSNYIYCITESLHTSWQGNVQRRSGNLKKNCNVLSKVQIVFYIFAPRLTLRAYNE